MTPTAVLDL